jgi:hypothetical protein
MRHLPKDHATDVTQISRSTSAPRFLEHFRERVHLVDQSALLHAWSSDEDNLDGCEPELITRIRIILSADEASEGGRR